jgi:hypothetical protein
VSARPIGSPAAKLCECGCGQPAPIAKGNNSANGYVKGQPTRFVRGHYKGTSREGRRPTNFVEVGNRFGLGVVIDPGVRIPDSSSTGSRRGARLRCDCGNEYVAGIGPLLRGVPKSCGCYTAVLASEAGRRGGRPITDRTGQRYGKLVVVRFVEVVNGHARWLCRCDCGNEITVAAGGLLKAVGCGCAQSAPRGGRAAGEASRKHVLTQYQRNAQYRDLPWELTDDDFDKLTSSDCHYCGLPPGRVFRSGAYIGGEFVYSGLDRLDNTAGYVPGNVVPCCWDCNRAKSDLSYDEFMTWLGRVTAHQWFSPDQMPSHFLNGRSERR